MAAGTQNAAGDGHVRAVAVTVKLGGSDVAEQLGCGIRKISVKLSSRDESQAEIMLCDCYDIKTHSLASGLRAGLELGAVVEVSMGYQSDLTVVFNGYMESVSLDMTEEDAYILRIRAYDVIRLLKENVRCRIWKGTSHSSVVTELLEDYSWICASDVESTSELKAEEDWWQQESDYDFIVNELAGIHNPDYRFYVSDGTAFFKKEKDDKAAVSLEPGDGITEFHASWHFLNRKIQVHGISGTHEVYLGVSEAAGKNISSGAGQGFAFYAIPQAGSQDAADAVAAVRAERARSQAVEISLTTAGMPQLKPGKCLKLSGMDSWVNGIYRIEKAEHVADEDGYRTTVELGGC